MEDIVESISGFIGKLVSVILVGSAFLLVAGEIKLAALRKAKLGSTRLTTFTERMTVQKFTLKNSVSPYGQFLRNFVLWEIVNVFM